jgi:hypothetical protein
MLRGQRGAISPMPTSAQVVIMSDFPFVGHQPNANSMNEFGNRIEAKALRIMRHPTRMRKLEGFIELPGA